MRYFDMFSVSFSLSNEFLGIWLVKFASYSIRSRSLFSLKINKNYLNLDLFFVHVIKNKYIGLS